MYLAALIFISCFFALFFIVSIPLKNNSIVDFGWGLGFVLTTFYLLLTSGFYTVESLIVMGCITLWGGRLFAHILRRNWGQPEDFRYAAWRKAWGKWVILRSFFQIYIIQGLVMFVILTPVISIFKVNIQSHPWIFIVGIVIWLIGYVFEVIGDYQLDQFKKNTDNQGKVMKSGLWRYTRHPNYFGEATMWWGIFIMGLASGNEIWTIVSPSLITFLLLFVSGVPMLEKSMKNREGYEAYVEATSIFIPWPPKKIGQ